MKHDIFKKAAGLFGTLSLLLVVSTLYVAWEEISFYGHGKEAVGKVIGFAEEYKSGRKLRFPLVSFWDKQGAHHVGKSNLATVYGGGHKVGASYAVVYDDQHPDHIRENSFFGLFGKLLLVASMTYFNFILLLIFQYYLVITPAYNTHQIVTANN